MSAVAVIVLIGAAAVIAAVLWYFFGEKATLPSAETGRAAGERTELSISGMTCAACVSRIEKAARRVPGVADAHVNLLANQGAFIYDPGHTTPQTIAAAIAKIGYDATLPTAEASVPDHSAEGRSLLVRFWTAAVLTLPILWGSMGMEMRLPTPRVFVSPWFQLLVSVPALFGPAGAFFAGPPKRCRPAART